MNKTVNYYRPKEKKYKPIEKFFKEITHVHILLFFTKILIIFETSKYFHIFVKIKTRDMKNGIILPNKIIVKENKESEEKKTQAGIIVPVTKKKTTDSGVVTLVGDKVEVIKVGMTVLYTPLSATRFSIEDEELALLPESAVLFAFWSA